VFEIYNDHIAAAGGEVCDAGIPDPTWDQRNATVAAVLRAPNPRRN
jgi:hypothetical protein